MMLVVCSSSKPTQLIGGPGNTGRKLPKIPTSIKRNPRNTNKISIVKGCSRLDYDTTQLLQKIISVKCNDTNSQTYFDLASVYLKEEKLDSAKVFIKKGMDVQKPIFAYGYSRLADIARQEKDMEAALRFYKLAYEEDADDARIFYNICTVLDQLRSDPKEKLDYYEKFLKYYPNEHPFYYESVRKRIRELKEQIHFSED